MTTISANTQQATQILDQAYAQFKADRLARSKAALFDDAKEIFSVTEMVAGTRQYLFDDAIALRVIELQQTVIPEMMTHANQSEFLKLNFTGNDIRWLLGLPRIHRHRHAHQAE
ncbi:hypothetical protein [Lactiplantibacillus daowaiensis]|uniref:Uncharacterized protein n=1 Tax=Lactiplantibacillus daowaiensis TaxID=2559918 RepID=A0ABW1S2U2_9LACO|nr:hypothetical protein [Lactiplantibacillus daowaiensis]